MNIRIILWLLNLAKAYDLLDYAQMRYNLLGNGGHWFPGQKAERVAELDWRACLRDSPHADKIPDLLAEAHRLLGSGEVKRLSQQ